MMMERPNEFAQKAHDWAVKYAGAPRQEMLTHNYHKAAPPVAKNDPSRYVSAGKSWTKKSQDRSRARQEEIPEAWRQHVLTEGLLSPSGMQISRIQQGPGGPVRQHGLRCRRSGRGIHLCGYRPQWGPGLRAGGSVHGRYHRPVAWGAVISPQTRRTDGPNKKKREDGTHDRGEPHMPRAGRKRSRSSLEAGLRHRQRMFAWEIHYCSYKHPGRSSWE